MIELLFVVCLASASDVCETKALQFAEDMTPMACLMNAQPHLAQWQAQHPKWRISEWRCQAVSFAQRDV